MSFKRCPGCGMSPLPANIPYYWGNTKAEQAEVACKECRDRKGPMPLTPAAQSTTPKRKACVVVVMKLNDLRAELLKEHILGNELRDQLRLREYGQDCFISDGDDRLWRWTYFPYNRHQPLTWDGFLDLWPEFDLYELIGDKLEEVPEESEEAVTPPQDGPEPDPDTPFDHVKM